jgi:hypothetical protein
VRRAARAAGRCAPRQPAPGFAPFAAGAQTRGVLTRRAAMRSEELKRTLGELKTKILQ